MNLALPKPVKDAAGFVAIVLREFNHDHGPIMAAAASFFATLSLFPLLLIGLSALGYVYRGQAAFEELMRGLSQYAPQQVVDVVSGALATVVHTRGRVLLIGAITLLWSATSVFTHLQTALCITWDVPQRPMWKARLIALGMILLVGAGLAVTLGFAALTLRIEGLRWTVLGHPLPELPVIWRVLGFSVPALVGIGMFAVVYRVLPNTRVHPLAAAWGGLFGGVLWQVALQAFRAYLNHARYDVVYGSLAGVVMLVLWIYYSMVVLLLGAEVAWQTDQTLRARHGQPAETPVEKLGKPAPMP